MAADLLSTADVFDDDYLHFYQAFQTDEVNDAEAELIGRLLSLPSGSAVLDAACGYGRIANRLAGAGHRVVGVDQNPAFLDHAAAGANHRGVRVEYRCADLRELSDRNAFDAVVCWFSSFGYWDDRANHELLRNFRRALRPNGRLVLDLMNPALLARCVGPGGAPHRRARGNGADTMVDEVAVDLTASRVRVARTVCRDGRERTFTWSCRIYGIGELTSILHRSGFSVLHVCGDGGEPLTVDSGRQVVVAVAR